MRVGDPERQSNGYERVAATFARLREERGVGVAAVLAWARSLPAGTAVLDLGCGSGAPNAVALDRAGFALLGIDASPTLVAMFRKRLPHATVACEAVEDSRFFDRSFDAVLAIGLLFLLPEATQRALVLRIASVLRPGGRFLFTAPAQACAWDDALTGRRSRSLGAAAYTAMLVEAGLEPLGSFVDDGGNHHLDARRPGRPPAGAGDESHGVRSNRPSATTSARPQTRGGP